MARIPQVGDPLTTEDFEMILEAVSERSKNFPNEPGAVTLALVFFNIGDRFTPVECLEKEWTAIKQDVPKGEGVPKCPNGHPLLQGPGLRLGWISE